MAIYYQLYAKSEKSCVCISDRPQIRKCPYSEHLQLTQFVTSKLDDVHFVDLGIKVNRDYQWDIFLFLITV